MAKLLIGLSDCHEAFVAAPLVRELTAGGHQCRIAWAGDDAGLGDGRSLGLPELPVVMLDAVIDGAGPPAVATAALAARALGDADALLTIGTAPLASAGAHVARLAGRRVFRLDGGVRPRGAAGHAHQFADRAADALCVANEHQRNTLLQEGYATDSIAVVGSMLPDALGTPADGDLPQHPWLWLAIEHGDSMRACSGGVRRLLELAQQAAGDAQLTLHAVPRVLRPAAAAADVDLPGVFPAAASSLAQLQLARKAAIVVTDSLGHQALAAAAGVPCVVLASAGHGVRDDLVASGHVHVAPGCSALPDAVAAALRSRRPAAAAPTGAARAARAAIEGWLAPPAAPALHERTLPSDGDATGRTFDGNEIAAVTAALRTGTLNSTRGTFVARFEREFAQWLGRKHAIACASGSAAVHCAIAALGLAAGDEVITTPITDMGALTPIFYEGAVPVFADVDPTTLNVTARTIEAQLTARTKAIVVTHLFGCPCELDDIFELAERHGLPVVEDAAQAFGATWRGGKIGTFGKLAAFSLQQGKHITSGEGGIVCTDDDELARRLFLFVNKAWGYGDAQPDHYFPALNYRMTELQGAVLCAQLPKLDGVVAMRSGVVAGSWLAELAQLRGIGLPHPPEHGTHSYWKFALRVDAQVVRGGAMALGQRLKEQGVSCVPRYVQKPAFECQLFREWQRFPVMALPLGHNPRGGQSGPLFDRRDYPGAVRGLEQVVVVPINERYTMDDVSKVSLAIRTAHEELTR